MKKNYQEFIGHPGNHACDCCHHVLENWALYKDKRGWLCGSCMQDDSRAAMVAREVSTTIDKKLWTSEYGRALKVERNRLLDVSRWTIMPDSPLSNECQTAYRAYLLTLQQMTLTTATTDKWTWPAAPALIYPSVIATPAGATIRMGGLNASVTK